MVLSVLIASNTYPVYADLNEADEFMLASPNFDTWEALGDTTQARYLVSATRLLEKQRWKGNKTDDAQPLDWPRSNTGIDGVDNDIVPSDIIQASILLAYELSQGSDVETAQNQGQKIQELKAGSVGIKFFRGAEGIPTRFPTQVQELLRDYLAGSSSSIGAHTTGYDKETITGGDFGFTDGM